MRDELPPGAAREAGCLAGLGVLLFPALVWGFTARFDIPLPQALFLSALVGMLPALAVAQVPLARHADVERLGAYAGSAAMLAVLAVGATVLGWSDPGPTAMGLELPAGGTEAFLAWTGALLLAAAVLQAAFLQASRTFGWQESELLKHLLPRTRKEKQAFVGVSMIAGLGEEITFRGFAIPLLAPVVGGVWAAVAFTSMVFGLLHAYQGAIGIVRTALLGAAFAASFVLSGSLWPAVVAHFAVDLVVGVWLAERWL